jgi:exopolyphosphatase/guanosine-5'-triphosphate,3'-diphosphate pyrophosphatase
MKPAKDKMKTIASIDIGTNSVLYSLFEVRRKTKIDEIHFERHSPRIGGKLKGRRRITDESYDTLRRILQRQVKHAVRNGAEEVLIAATNPLRLAENGREVKKRLETDLNCRVAILSANREAYLSFVGAVGRLESNRTAVVIDLGGGSTELVVYRGSKRLAFVSLPDGAVSLTERFDAIGKVSPENFPKFDNYLSRYDKKILTILPYLKHPITLVGGTSAALAFLKDRDIHRLRKRVIITADEIELFTSLLSELNLPCRRRLLTVDKKRAEIIFAGSFWLGYLFKILKIHKATATPRGLRHGMVVEYLARQLFTA